MPHIYDYLLSVLFIISFGSYATNFVVNWPKQTLAAWQKEAHLLLNIPFADTHKEHRSPRSHCDTCSHTLSWQDLFPLISYLLMKGRCRYCQQPISLNYPIIELIHLFLCAPLLWLFEDPILRFLHIILLSALVSSATIDAKHKLLPDQCTGIVLACGLLINTIKGSLEQSVLGLLIGYGTIYALGLCYLKIRKREGIGLGDAKLVGALGAWLGLSYLTPLLLCASLLGILYTISLSRNALKEIPFGPFLIVSAIMMFYIAYDR